MAFNSTTKSSRTLQSRRYTTTGDYDFNNAFTQVFDLSIAEIYDQANLLPTASLPYSGSSQGGSILKGSDGVTDIAEYYYRLQLSPVNTAESGRFTTWFTISPTTASGVRGDEIQPGQLTNWVSNKYITPALAGNTAESSPVPGYNVYVSDGSGNIILSRLYQFDYKTGTLVFLDTANAPSSPIYLSGYRYLGRTLADNKTLGYSGSFSGSFQGDGNGLTNIPASGIVGLNLTQVATANTTASVSEGTTAFTLTRSGTPKFTIDQNGGFISLGNSAITGSLEISQNLVVQGTASFNYINSVTGSAKIIGDAFIILNADSPASRFAGLKVIDSGSSNATGSLLYDAETDLWLYDSTTEGYAAGFLVGPKSLNIENLSFPSEFSVVRGDGEHHITETNIYTTASNVTINKGGTGSLAGLEILGDLEVTGSARFTAGVSGSFSGSFQGNGGGLTNIPASGIVGLNLTQIADNNITASVSSTGTPFRVRDGLTSKFEVNNAGGITVYSTSSLRDIQVTGSAVVQDTLTAENTLLVLQTTILSGSIQTSGSTTLEGTNTLVGTTEITGSATIISDIQVTGSINTSGSTNTVGTVTITGSITVSGSSTLTNIGPAEFTGSTGILGTLNTEGTSSVTGTALVSGSTILSGSTDIEGPTNIVGITTITGSTLLPSPTVISTTSSVREGDYALSISQSAWFYNHNAGVPRSNAWKDKLNGSYFNNFDSNTNVSEILRFMAGLLSASAPDASPNTKYYNSINNNSPSLSNSSIAGYVPQDFAGSDIIYLNSKGFADAGSTIFNGVGTVYTTLNPTYNFTSVAAGPTIVSSSADDQLFGLGTIGTAFNVSGALNWRFDDNFTQIVTETSSSQAFLTRSTTGASNPGLTIGEIQTVNPDVIPNAYQDGRFRNIFNMTFYNGGRSLTSVSSSGWYHVSASIAIQSGSSVYSGFKNNFTKVFAAPISNISIPAQTISFTQSVTPLTATSRSLSGAPYLQTATWNFQVTSSGVFEPLYYGNSTIFNVTDNSTLVTPTGTTTQLMSGGDISGTSLVYDSTGATQRTSGVPFRTDRIQTSITETFTAGTTNENINQIGLGTTLYTITSTSYNRSGTPSSTGSQILFHEPGTFGQPSDSGSMAYYGRSQATDGGTFTRSSAGSLIAEFSGENYRLQINDNILSGSYSLGTAWNTSFGLYNLTGNDLQVKPGFLVKPGGSYGYWITDPDPSQTYKYYAVGFTRDLTGNQPNISMSLEGNTTLVNWTATGSSNTISALIIPQSVLGTTTTAAGIDPTAAATTLLTSADARNPFGRDLNILANSNTGKTNPFVIDFPTSPNAFPLNTTYRNFVLLIRYIGNPTPLTKVTFTITA